MKGRKPKPTNQKRIQGNPGKRPLNSREPKPKTAVKKPWGMAKLTKKFWEEHAPELERIQVLTGIDAAAFRLMAEAYAFAIEAAKDLRDEGFTVEGRDGPKTNPTARAWRDNAMLFKSLAVEFGMTPSARSRLKLPEEAEQMSLADMLFHAVNEEADRGGD